MTGESKCKRCPGSKMCEGFWIEKYGRCLVASWDREWEHLYNEEQKEMRRCPECASVYPWEDCDYTRCPSCGIKLQHEY